MKKKQSILKITGLFLIFVLLLISIIFVNNLLKEEPGQAVTTIKRTKAATKTYSRLLALNNQQPTISPTLAQQGTESPSPTEILLAKNHPTITGGQYQNNPLTPTVFANNEITDMQGTPTVDPTAELLARNSNITVTASSSISPTSSIIPTKTQKLPETGWIQYSLILFAAATTMFFLAFIF